MRRTLVLATALLLICVPLARAKGFELARACGAGECRTTQLHDRLPPIAIPPELGGTITAAPAPAPWYRVRFRFTGAGPHADLRVAVLADHSRVAGREVPTDQYVWYRLGPGDARAYARFTRGLEPLSAASMPEPGLGSRRDSPESGAGSVGGGGSTGGDGGSGFPWAAALGAIVLAGLISVLALRRHPGIPASLSGYILGPRTESEQERHAHGEKHEGSEGVGREQVGER